MLAGVYLHLCRYACTTQWVAEHHNLTNSRIETHLHMQAAAEGRERPADLSPPATAVYLVRLSGRPGKFLPDKARQLGVKPGPVSTWQGALSARFACKGAVAHTHV
mgnify:CR=1 FL=1